MPFTLNEKSPNVPTEERAAKTLRRHLEAGTLDEIGGLVFPSPPRYLVTYMNSQTGGRVRSTTLVSVTNQSDFPTTVTVSWFKGFSDNSSPVGASTVVIPPDFTVDFGSRHLPSEITVVNSTPVPELTFDEGRALVQSRVRKIGVSARVVYTSGDRDEELLAITDSKVVRCGEGNTGD